MKTVKQVANQAGVSIRTLHHYDAIGLLKPTAVTDAGYRLYDDAALERLYMIMVFRELDFSLAEIARILNAPDYDPSRVLETQINLMREQIGRLQDRIALAKGILKVGVKNMDFTSFDAKKMDQYSVQAKTLYGKTDAYKEYQQKAQKRTKEQEKDLGSQVMDFFVRLAQMRPCAPDCEAARNWAKDLQAFFTEHYYNCTPQILSCLAESYADGGSMNENIDKAGGSGTGAFAKEVIDVYLKTQL